MAADRYNRFAVTKSFEDFEPRAHQFTDHDAPALHGSQTVIPAFYDVDEVTLAVFCDGVRRKYEALPFVS